MFNRVEQVDEGIVTGADVLDRLIRIHVTRIYESDRKKMSYSKEDSKAGKYGLCRWECLKDIWSEMWNTREHLPTYYSYRPTKGRASRGYTELTRHA
jgi:hypothetical protein